MTIENSMASSSACTTRATQPLPVATAGARIALPGPGEQKLLTRSGVGRLLEREGVLVADAVVLDVVRQHHDAKDVEALREADVRDREGLPRIPSARVRQRHRPGDVDAVGFDAELRA